MYSGQRPTASKKDMPPNGNSHPKKGVFSTIFVELYCFLFIWFCLFVLFNLILFKITLWFEINPIWLEWLWTIKKRKRKKLNEMKSRVRIQDYFLFASKPIQATHRWKPSSFLLQGHLRKLEINPRKKNTTTKSESKKLTKLNDWKGFDFE